MKPIKFAPLLKSTIWGGNKIIAFKHLDIVQQQVGESWEVSGLAHSESIVRDGLWQGKKLNEVIELMKGDLIGKANYDRFGNVFPLLIKFIDAQQNLSIQVHPSDEIAKRHGIQSGKTEMWYVMKSDPNAYLNSGLKKTITQDEYKQMVENDTITDVVANYPVQEGDCFFLPAGRIHSIGPGCFLAEIQQTSDVTYRIYDFKRKDKEGNYRELHTNEAAECIDFSVQDNYRQEYVPKKNQGVSLIQCKYFSTTVYDLDQSTSIDISTLDSFVVLIGLKGNAIITDNENNETELCEGETILIPATTQKLQIEGTIKFLETHI